MEGIREILSVLPSGVASLHCTLLDEYVLSHFETAGAKLNRLTENGWLSFWAMFALENPEHCFSQLTYLDLSTDTDRSTWYHVTSSKREDKLKQQIDRTVVRILLFGGPGCGKVLFHFHLFILFIYVYIYIFFVVVVTVFCNRLLSRIPSGERSFGHRTTTRYRSVANRIGEMNEYYFIAITEIPANERMVESAIDNYIPHCAYDMILLAFDLSQSRSFYEMDKIFHSMPRDHGLPIQVVGMKADLKHVNQYNQDENDRKYDVQKELAEWGLRPYVEIWLNQQSSTKFAALFDDLYFIATNP
ncbi:hypothetical protein RFI_23962 [Reticulomyxa filosa]|uniref:Mitochondrial Rho GTPase 1/3 EF hand associated type-1 domain-containing protein n=1 Tax=Reticulomyxa filosa TaxID=46433 RepID=X6MIF6_RETFI|nr:hypothetical protein RFI_23962 [Reticulomyxa filosa]|eukprot:ETO13411.1 hypothetical protein RFI_23962 [Reticulomyxa filosa]